MSPPAFGDVDLFHQGPNPLSPEQPGLGLSIAAPLVANDTLPVCITVTREGAHLAHEPSYELAVVAVDAATGRPWAAVRGQADDRLDDDPIPGARMPSQVTSWFNLDVAELCGLPSEPGVYYVFAVLCDLQSNVCRVQWEGR
jgi:hypothetical protein